MKKRLLLLTFGIYAVSVAVGQQAPLDQKMLLNISGGMNGSIGNLSSPNLFDGSTNVNIPIHQYGDFGISLSYNTKGVTVGELSGQIGTHWNLNAGGTITRTVKDIPDEANQKFDDNNTINNTYSILGRAHVYNVQGAQPNVQYWDGENDEFNVSAGPLQFTFKLGKNGYVFTYPENRYKITPIAYSGYDPDGTSIFDKFQITDNQGNQYTFGTHTNTKTKGSIVFGNTNMPGANGAVVDFYSVSQWFLDEVKFSNGQKITYTYLPLEYPVEDPPAEGLDLYRAASQIYKSNGSIVFQNAAAVPMGDSDPHSFILKSIQYPDNTMVDFSFDQGDAVQNYCMKSIRQIKISQGDNCVKYRFNKSYLQRNGQVVIEVPFDNACNYDPSGAGNTPARRMILKSIDILSCDETESQPYYSFEYSNTLPPPRFGNNRDFFGYCNYINDPSIGNQNNYLTQPTNGKSPFDNSNGEQPCNRKVTDDVSIMAALCLTKVKNGFGGSLSFQYELHSGLSAVTDNIAGIPNPDLNYLNHLFVGKNAADGLRLLRTIAEDYYRPGNKLITTYTYSGGQFFLNGGTYAYPVKKDINNNVTEYIGTANWVSPHQLINGSNHGYSRVEITTTTENTNNILSKTVHYFSNFSSLSGYYTLNGPAGQTKHYFQLPYTDKQYLRDWKIGLLLETETFDRNGNIVSRTNNIYDTESENDFSSAEAGLGVNVHTMRASRVGSSGIALNEQNVLNASFNLVSDSYVPFRGKALLMSTTTKKYINNSTYITDNVEYTYDDLANQQTITTHNSKGENYMTRNVYNYDVSGPNVPAGNQAGTDLYNMTLDGIEKVVSTERWKLEPSSGPPYYLSNDKLMDASITKYTYGNNEIRTQKLFVLQSLDPISYSSYTGITPGGNQPNPFTKVLTAYNSTQCPAGLKEVSEVLQYDVKGNPIETQLGDQNTYQSMIWDLPTGNKLAVANCKLNEMAFSSFESENKGNWAYNQANVIVPSTNVGIIDGAHVLRANSGDSGPFLSVSNLTPNKEYTLTFWKKVGELHITGGGITSGDIPYNLVYGDYSPGNLGWRYFQAKFTPVNSSPVEFRLIATGSPFTIYLDDVRLFPTGATLQCWNYQSLWGASSSVDPTGRITYYEYDPFGRLHITRDQEGNIIAKKDFHIGQ